MQTIPWAVSTRRVLLGLGVAVALAACGRELPIQPDVAAPGGAIQACAGVGLDAFLHGDPSDPRTAWVANGNVRTDVLFPAGYSARFAPLLEVLDPAGNVVMREGDYVYGACVGRGDTLTLDPGESLRLECGPLPVGQCTASAPRIASNQPGRSNAEVAEIRFKTADGAYVVTFDDGTTAEGVADLAE